MKKMFAMILCLGYLFSNAQIDPKVGDKFIYDVDAGGQQYNFTIVIKSLLPNVSFAWQMTNEDFSYGKVTIPAAAMTNSSKMYNYFSGGDVVLNNMTSVMLSRATYAKILSEKKIDIFDGSKKISLDYNGKDNLDYIMNAEHVSDNALYLSNENSDQFAILDNPKFPIILSMKIGWSIRLSEYIPASATPLNLASFVRKNITDVSSAALWQKMNKTSTIEREDLNDLTPGSKALYNTYYAYAEGLKVETRNDTVLSIIYYPVEIKHEHRKFYGANFAVPQIKNFTLAKAQMKKTITDKFSESTSYGADYYILKDKGSMGLYYHVPTKGKSGLQFGMGGDGTAATQKVGFVTFQ